VTDQIPRKFNIVRHWGSPTEVVLDSGHKVTKQDYVYFKNTLGQWVMVKCADYHGAHFVYLDPLYNEEGPDGVGHWFAMCTCGSPAVIIGPTDAAMEETSPKLNLLVCYAYHLTLTTYGFGWHQGQGGQKWE